MISRSFYMVILTLLILMIPGFAATDVYKSPQPQSSLQDGWKWAEKKAGDLQGGIWVGYSIRQLMRANSFIGSYHSSSNSPTLEQIISGKAGGTKSSARTGEETVAEAAKRALQEFNDSEELSVLEDKEIAFLFYYRDMPVNPENIDDMKISNLSLPVNLNGRPLIWLGLSEPVQSVQLLSNFYEKVKSMDVKEKIISAVGIHRGETSAFQFLKNVIKAEKSPDLREKAVFWIGQQGNPQALQVLLDVTKNDNSGDVREHAVFSISQLKEPEATDALIDLARNGKDYDVRKKAIFWLGQKASKVAAETLEDVANDDPETELQEQAVFALSQLSSGEGIPALIKIATNHPNLSVRKKAIFWLGQSDDPRAFETLVDIVRKKN